MQKQRCRSARSSCKADQRLCFRFKDSAIPLLPKSKIPSLWPSSVLVQLSLCQICLKTTLLVFSLRGSFSTTYTVKNKIQSLIPLHLIQLHTAFVVQCSQFHQWKFLNLLLEHLSRVMSKQCGFQTGPTQIKLY